MDGFLTGKALPAIDGFIDGLCIGYQGVAVGTEHFTGNQGIGYRPGRVNDRGSGGITYQTVYGMSIVSLGTKQSMTARYPKIVQVGDGIRGRG